MSEAGRTIEVYADWIGLDSATRLGTLSVQAAQGKEVFSFEYDATWLRRDDNRILDPDLRFYKGPQYAGSGKPNFGLFLDSSPDRWGRVLMRRREAILARKEGRAPRRLGEADYLLGVYDKNRMGALRFKVPGSEAYQSSDAAMATPPWSTLRDLEYASFLVEHEEDDEKLDPWLAMLIAPGSSLGGARPKASVVDEKGELWIAKFPGKDDERDWGAWEMLVADLARVAGIEMSECRLDSFSKRGSTFLTKRFDRIGEGRIHFASAMTLLGRKDGDDAAAGASYLELAEFIMRSGARPDADLGELWKRIVFSIAVSNTDDHLRNHGFLLDAKGWRLSPAYDINPSPDSAGLSLAIDEYDNSLDFELALSVAPYFRLSKPEALSIMESIRGVTATWRERAKALGIRKPEIERMQGAFENQH
ncbi:MAG TPA: HipA domain-containing protein [Spirochaetales bacterium]|nr:HipA domain-containing protein [Spirochaetales bacterium]